MSSNFEVAWSGWENAARELQAELNKQEVDTVYDNYTKSTFYEHLGMICENHYSPCADEMNNLEDNLDLLMAMLENTDSKSSHDSHEYDYSQVENFITKYSNNETV